MLEGGQATETRGTKHNPSAPAAILPLLVLRASRLTIWPLSGLSQWRLRVHMNTTPPANQRRSALALLAGRSRSPPKSSSARRRAGGASSAASSRDRASRLGGVRAEEHHIVPLSISSRRRGKLLLSVFMVHPNQVGTREAQARSYRPKGADERQVTKSGRTHQAGSRSA